MNKGAILVLGAALILVLFGLFLYSSTPALPATFHLTLRRSSYSSGGGGSSEIQAFYENGRLQNP